MNVTACSHRVVNYGEWQCTHPAFHSERNTTYPRVCTYCTLADNGIRTVEPRRLDDIPRGLGDTAADALKIIGIEQKQGCGCSARQSWLNQRVSYERLPTLARDGKTWANWLCKLIGIKTGLEPKRILFRFPHGFGDAVQFTVALQHLRAKYPQNYFGVVTKPGCGSLFRGVAHGVVEQPTAEAVWGFEPEDAFDFDVNIDWWEPDACYVDSPATKAEKCLREAFGLPPQIDFCRYKINTTADQRDRAAKYLAGINATGRAFVFHYQGNTVQVNKTLDEQIATKIIRDVIARGMVPIVLDWDVRSCFTREPENWPEVHNPGSGHWLWGGEHQSGDGGTMAALIGQASFMLGIDSGPGHVAGATDTPTLIVWLGHHPINYYGLSPNVTHVITEDHGALIYGDRETGEKFFAEHYNSAVAQEHYRYSLPKIVAAMLDRKPVADVAPPFEFKPAPEYRFEFGHWVRSQYAANDLDMIREVHEQDVYRLAEIDRPLRYVVDVGAHIGSFATAVTPRLEAGGRVVCVEVNAANLEALGRNHAGDNVHGAVTYERGKIVLLNSIFEGATAGPGDSEVVRAHEARSTLSGDAGRHRVECSPPTYTIESLIADYRLPWIDLLKLDCEGSEWSILEGLACHDRIGMIVGEYHRGEERLQELADRRFPGWDFRILSSKMPDVDDGSFWLVNPDFARGN